MKRTVKYRLYPTKNQCEILNFTLNTCRKLYNDALTERIWSYQMRKKSINYYDQQNELPELKEEFFELDNIHSQVLQNVLKKLDNSFKNFFRRIKLKKEKAGYPRYKAPSRFDSFTYPQNIGFDLLIENTNSKYQKIKLSKIGYIKLKYSQFLHKGAKMKTCTIKKTNNKWYACISYEFEKIVIPKPITKVIGVDLGIEKFATTSENEIIENPKFLKKNLEKLKNIQSEYSKSNYRNKRLRKKLNQLHEKIKNQRTNFLHKESRKLVNQNDCIILEDLNIKGMQQNNFKNLNRNINDVSWGNFINFLLYKAEEAGTTVKFVNPKNTSAMCSFCGYIKTKELSERMHSCENCGLNLDRDLNSAINIKKLGTNLLNQSV